MNTEVYRIYGTGAMFVTEFLRYYFTRNIDVYIDDQLFMENININEDLWIDGLKLGKHVIRLKEVEL